MLLVNLPCKKFSTVQKLKHINNLNINIPCENCIYFLSRNCNLTITAKYYNIRI